MDDVRVLCGSVLEIAGTYVGVCVLDPDHTGPHHTSNGFNWPQNSTDRK